MFKAGQKVIYKYPAKNRWADGHAGEADGYLRLNQLHTILDTAEDYDGHPGLSIRVQICPYDGSRARRGWWASAACFVPVSQRNLPDWW